MEQGLAFGKTWSENIHFLWREIGSFGLEIERCIFHVLLEFCCVKNAASNWSSYVLCRDSLRCHSVLSIQLKLRIQQYWVSVCSCLTCLHPFSDGMRIRYVFFRSSRFMWRGSFTLGSRKVRVAYFHTRTRESIDYFVFQFWRDHLLV